MNPSHSGEILYCNVPIEQIGLPVVRGNVALMLQQAQEGRVKAEGSYDELQEKGLIREDFDFMV